MSRLKKQLLSFIIPVKNEEKSIPQLVREIIDNVHKTKSDYEIIFIDDGSSDNTFNTIVSLTKKNHKIKVVKHRRNFGKSAALTSGFNMACGDIVFTLDGDLQDNPIEIPKFIKKIESGYDMVSGWKQKRLDSKLITLPSKIGNSLISYITKIKIHDLNCGFKAYKSDVVKKLSIYGELYRFIPILVNQMGYKIAEIPVDHRRRKYGKSKYNFLKAISIIFDLITILFLRGYSTRPGHFFGVLGLTFFVPGFLIGMYITYLRITTGGIEFHYPLLFLGVLLMVVSVQFVSTGLLAEMFISFENKSGHSTNIEKVIK